MYVIIIIIKNPFHILHVLFIIKLDILEFKKLFWTIYFLFSLVS